MPIHRSAAAVEVAPSGTPVNGSAYWFRLQASSRFENPERIPCWPPRNSVQSARLDPENPVTGHDGRAHKSQKRKRPFTAAELKALGR